MAKFILVIVSISLLISSIFCQCTVENARPYFKRSVYEFSVDLMTRIAEETESHFVASALSPWTLIAALSLGASDQTLTEIQKVLRLHPHKCFNNKFFEIMQEISESREGVVLERSSTFFIDDQLPLEEDFERKVKNTKVSDIEIVSFNDIVSVASIINDYVSRATKGTVDEIVSPNDLEGVMLVLIDALYFKGTWQTQFSSADTETSAFYDENGQQTGDVNLMFTQQLVNITKVNAIESTVLELPYGNDGKYSMWVFLPNAGVSIPTVIDKLKHITLSSINILFSQNRPSSVLIQIPRLKMSSDLDNLKELLVDMGLSSMFDSTEASFSSLSEYPLFVSNFIQKATIELNEEGSEASAASGAFLEGRSASLPNDQFTANRPFLFMIVDKVAEMALFTGAYSKPSLY